MEVMTFNIDKDRRNLVDDKQNFSIDFHDSKYNWLQARQYEKEMRQVEVHVVHGNGSPFDLTGINPVFEGWLPEGIYRIIDAKHSVMIDAQNGIFRFDFPAPAFQIAGSYKQAFFRLMKDGMSVTTLEFSLEVLADKVISGLVPSDYITPFEDEYDKLIAIVEKADSKFAEQLIKWQNEFNKIIGNLNGDYLSIKSLADALDARLEKLEDKIEADGLLTQAELDTDLTDLKKEIKDGLDALNNINDGLVDVPDIDGGIPDYNIDPLQKLSAQIDPNKFNLGFGTDYHYDIGSDYGIFPGFSSEVLVRNWRAGLRKSLNILSLSNQLDAIVFNGDNTDSPIVPDLGVERKLMVKEAEDFASTAFRLSECPVFILKGNHDNNYNFKPENLIPENVLLDADFKRIYRQNGSFGEKRLSGSNYYYRDFPEKKIRLIGLDSSDFPESTNEDGTLIYDKFLHSGFQETQLNWLANEALQAPEGYGVLITMHWPVNHTVYDYADDIMINHSVLKTILEDFAAGCDVKEVTSSGDLPVDIKYQFKGKGNLIAVLSGHRHLDQQVTMNGINYVLTRCSLSTGDNMIREKRMTYEGTPLEDAFDVVSVDTTARTMTLTRFGAGSEDARYATREFSY